MTESNASNESIRDRLKAPAGQGEQSGAGDTRGSELYTSDFQQTDSRAELPHGEHQSVQRGTAAAPPELDLDPAARASAERKVAGLFLMSVVGVVGFIATFIAVPFDFGTRFSTAYTPLLGFFMALALTGIGAGAVLWAKTLMVDEETTQERHHQASAPEDRAEAAALLKQGFQDSGLPRRSLLRNSILLGVGSLALLPLPLFTDLGSWRHKERVLSTTAWRKGSRLLDSLGRPVKIGDLEIGGATTVFPDVPGGRTQARSASLLIRMRPDQLKQQTSRADWSVDGHIVYSVVCTHLGCPVKLYEQQTHHLFCPCHQSTFDASNQAKVLFGPAARPLPQLAISVDAEGYFIAQGDYAEPVGPSFWERKPSYDTKAGS